MYVLILLHVVSRRCLFSHGKVFRRSTEGKRNNTHLVVNKKRQQVRWFIDKYLPSTRHGSYWQHDRLLSLCDRDAMPSVCDHLTARVKVQRQRQNLTIVSFHTLFLPSSGHLHVLSNRIGLSVVLSIDRRRKVTRETIFWVGFARGQLIHSLHNRNSCSYLLGYINHAFGLSSKREKKKKKKRQKICFSSSFAHKADVSLSYRFWFPFTKWREKCVELLHLMTDRFQSNRV